MFVGFWLVNGENCKAVALPLVFHRTKSENVASDCSDGAALKTGSLIPRRRHEGENSHASSYEVMANNLLSCAGVAQLGEQQTEVPSILEVPCSIHGPGIFIFFLHSS